MAPRKSKATEPENTTALAKWDEELAKAAAESAGMEANAGGGQFFSIKGGILQWQGNPLKDNQMAVVIVDHILENVYYEGAYDPDSPAGPVCFAHGRDETQLKPHQLAVLNKTAQHEQCTGCPQNQWGTADKGRGKACKNSRRLAMISAGEFDKDGRFKAITDPDHFLTTAVGYFKLPVTSVKGYAGFVKQVAAGVKRPPHGIFTKVKVVPDPATQFKVVFEAIENVPNSLMAAVMKRHQEVRAAIEFPYQIGGEAEAKPAPKKADRRAPAKAGAKAQGRKY